jgi:hypothetical protein
MKQYRPMIIPTQHNLWDKIWDNHNWIYVYDGLPDSVHTSPMMAEYRQCQVCGKIEFKWSS